MADAITKNRHVIFLGAGASFSSGYPLASGLRLRLCSERQFVHDLREATDSHSIPATTYWQRFLDKFRLSISAFREGGFATVDEFSKLASQKNAKEVQDMKVLIRFALAFHNPELRFEQSDYNALLPKLFDDGDLYSLKSHITILTYNYDFYLNYLIERAERRRRGIAGVESLPIAPRFQIFNLHGSIRDGNDANLYGKMFFNSEAKARLDFLMDDYHMKWPPPIVFPWELFDESGNFIREDDFIFVKTLQPHDSSVQKRKLFREYKDTWEQARDAVQKADKISFVGLSAHGYMDAGLKYLFEGKTNGVEMVVANDSNKQFKNHKNRLHPASLCGKLHTRFRKLLPNLRYVQSSSERDGNFYDGPDSPYEPSITPRDDFKEFIQTEMD